MRRAAIRTLSLAYTAVRNYIDWNTFSHISEGIFLGMIPTKSALFVSRQHYDMHKQIIAEASKVSPERPLRFVVSMTEEDELKGDGFYCATMVSPRDWHRENVKHRLIKMADFTATVPDEAVIDAIFAMNDVLRNNGSTYIHCKAGRSRSVMFCAIYLSVFGTDPNDPREMPLEKAADLIRSRRPHIEFDVPKVVKAREIIEKIRKMLRKQAYLSAALPSQFGHGLFSIIHGYNGGAEEERSMPGWSNTV